MTVSAYSRNTYSTNNSTTEFAFTFEVFDSSELVVTLVNNTTGDATTLVETTNYTVTFTGSSPYTGGTVTTVSTYDTGYTLIISRSSDQTQTTDLQESGRLPADAVENQFDKQQMQIQELQAQVNKCLRFPLGDSTSLTSQLDNFIDRANSYLKFDSDGNATTVASVADLSAVELSAFMSGVMTSANASALQTAIGLKDEDDMSSNSALYPPSQQSVKAYVDARNNVYNVVASYSAVGDGATDDTTAIQNAIDAAGLAGGGIVFLPAGTYKVTGLAINSKAKVVLCGAGVDLTEITLANSSNDDVIDIDTSTSIVVCNLTIDGNGGNQTAGSGIRLDTTTDVRISNVKIYETLASGINVADGTNTRNVFENIVIIDPGVHGIVISDTGGSNSGTYLNNIYVSNPGNITAASKGLSLKGKCLVNNIHVVNIEDGHFGIRFEVGSDYSSLSNFFVRGDNSGTTSYGLLVEATNVSVCNGNVIELGYGINANDNASYVSFTNINVNGCLTVGIIADADYMSVINCKSIDNVIGLNVDSAGISIKGCILKDNSTRDLGLVSGSTTTIIEGNYIGGTVTNAIGTEAKFRNNTGYKTENWGTATIVDGGVVTDPEYTAHGLGAAPTYVSVTSKTDVGDNEFLYVESVDATNIVFKCENPASTNINFYWEAKVR